MLMLRSEVFARDLAHVLAAKVAHEVHRLVHVDAMGCQQFLPLVPVAHVMNRFHLFRQDGHQFVEALFPFGAELLLGRPGFGDLPGRIGFL